MNVLHDLLIGLLMLFVAFVVFDWGRIWWHARRHGYIRIDGNPTDPPWRWHQAYLGYKVWTWSIRIATWVIASWHGVLGLCWLAELVLYLTAS